MQHEVDIIAKNRKIIPVEVKYRATISTGDIKNMEIFMKKKQRGKRNNCYKRPIPGRKEPYLYPCMDFSLVLRNINGVKRK